MTSTTFHQSTSALATSNHTHPMRRLINLLELSWYSGVKDEGRMEVSITDMPIFQFTDRINQ
jgi:hypothetical protein